MKIPSKPPTAPPVPSDTETIQSPPTPASETSASVKDTLDSSPGPQTSQETHGHQPTPPSTPSSSSPPSSTALPDVPGNLAKDLSAIATTALVSPQDIEDGEWKLTRYTLTLDAVAKHCLEEPTVQEALGRLVAPQKEKTDQRLQKAVCDTLSELKGESFHGSAPENNPRGRYKSFLSNLREASTKAHKDKGDPQFRQDAQVITQALARSFFTGIPETSFHRDLVHATRTNADPNQNFVTLNSNQGTDLATRLEQSQDLIMSQKGTLENPSNAAVHLRNVAGNIMAGELGANYDPYLQGNTPYRLFELETKNQNSTCIRMGTATMQSTAFSPHVTPEFTDFIQGQGPDEHHLYINRQKRSGVEGGRSHALEAFQEKPDIQKHLTVITLAADGDLYNQAHNFAGACDIASLKETFISEIMQNHEGFYFPEGLKERLGGSDGFATALGKAFDQAQHQLGISDGVQLPQNQRRAILFHFLNKTLVEDLVDTVKATTYNNTCKDDIDRGGMANAYMYAINHRPQVDASPAEREDFAQNLEGVSFAPAMIVKKRGVVPHRFHDLTNALQQLEIWNS